MIEIELKLMSIKVKLLLQEESEFLGCIGIKIKTLSMMYEIRKTAYDFFFSTELGWNIEYLFNINVVISQSNSN